MKNGGSEHAGKLSVDDRWRAFGPMRCLDSPMNVTRLLNVPMTMNNIAIEELPIMAYLFADP